MGKVGTKMYEFGFFSVLNNCSPAGHFESSRGLRQGDLISPPLFLIVVEALGGMLEKTKGVGMIEEFRAEESHKSLLQIVDDALSIYNDFQRQIRWL